MLVPAILYRDQIEREFQRLYYTKDMLFETGCLGQWTPEISDSPDDGRFDYAIVSNNKLKPRLMWMLRNRNLPRLIWNGRLPR